MKTILLSTVAVLGLSIPAMAQTEIAAGANVTGVSDINDRIDDIEEAVQDDFDRSGDSARYGFTRRDGVWGGVSLSYNARSGNSEAQDLSLGGRVTHSSGPFTQNVGVVLDYAEDDNGDADTKDVSLIYDATYDVTDRAYVFALGSLKTDGTVSDDIDDYNDGTISADDLSDLDGRVKRDAYLGFGPGYRVIQDHNTTWRVQAGVGVRHTQTVDLSLADRIDSDTDTGYIASSRFSQKFNDRLFLTNDTDYLTSDANDTATNELALNYKFSENLLGRASYQTEYVSDREERTDNKLGVSLGFQF